jgi:transposase-like protein
VLILSIGAIGVVRAQQPATPSPTAPGQTTQPRPGHAAFIEALARRLGITTDQLQQAITEARNEVGLPARGPKPGFGFGQHGHSFGGRGLGASVAAQAIGISVEQLREELPGKSLAQVAQAHGKNPADVATALKNAANQRIDEAVAAGRLTADQATQLKQRVAQRIDQQINQVKPEGDRPFGGHHGRDHADT